MITCFFRRSLPALAAAAILTGSCGRDTRDPEATPVAADGQSMHMDPAMMRRHADEAASVVTRMREHVREMRALPSDRWHERMSEHSARVSEMLNLITRQVREMDMGMGMSDADMGAMTGMSAQDYRRMLDEVGALREEAERLQVASDQTVRAMMPPHLDRVAGLLGMLERAAEHMRHAADRG